MNDQAAEKLAARHPERLRAFAAVPMQDPDKAADELRRAVSGSASLMTHQPAARKGHAKDIAEVLEYGVSLKVVSAALSPNLGLLKAL